MVPTAGVNEVGPHRLIPDTRAKKDAPALGQSLVGVDHYESAAPANAGTDAGYRGPKPKN